MTRLWILVFGLVSLAPGVTHAYIGPGAGISAIGSLLTLIAAVLLAAVGFVWYPAKRLLKNRQKARTKALEKEAAGSS